MNTVYNLAEAKEIFKKDFVYVEVQMLSNFVLQ